MKLGEPAKWIKMPIDLWDDGRLECILMKENGAEIAVILTRLNLLAGRCNCGGELWLNEYAPYDAELLAAKFRFSQETVEKALDILQKYKFVQITDGIISILGWNEFQSLDELEASRAYHRQKQKEYRERLKMKKETLNDKNVNDTLKQVNDKKGYIDKDKDKDKDKDIDIDIDIERDKDKDKDLDGDGDKNIDVNKKASSESQEALIKEAVEAFNTTTSFQKINYLSKKQKVAVVNAVKEFGLEGLKKAFLAAENSEFLKGNNKQGWIAGFDWLIQPENLAKVLNGNYDSVYTPPVISENPPSMSSVDTDEFVNAALSRGFNW